MLAVAKKIYQKKVTEVLQLIIVIRELQKAKNCSRHIIKADQSTTHWSNEIIIFRPITCLLIRKSTNLYGFISVKDIDFGSEMLNEGLKAQCISRILNLTKFHWEF